MNSCILMADIIQEPQLRYTSDNLEVAEMLVQFPGMRENDPPATLKIVSWGKIAREIQQNYHQGDRVILEGRLGMHTIERREGFKEKRAELTIQKIYALSNRDSTFAPHSVPNISTSAPSTNTEYDSALPITTPMTGNLGVGPQQDWNQPVSTNLPGFQPSPAPATNEEADIDDIPF
ncbi:MAG: single-stranded DNA-binding protein [Richelia sp.]|nr:single-stranded DNA-binding protein [Richelia sp.]CDN17047.1 Single-stranded DNA-binding protein [Richelia intracellularis]